MHIATFPAEGVDKGRVEHSSSSEPFPVKENRARLPEGPVAIEHGLLSAQAQRAEGADQRGRSLGVLQVLLGEALEGVVDSREPGRREVGHVSVERPVASEFFERVFGGEFDEGGVFGRGPCLERG